MDMFALLPDNHPLLAQVMPAFDFKSQDATAIEQMLLARMERHEACRAGGEPDRH
jgi:hypothetical protein